MTLISKIAFLMAVALAPCTRAQCDKWMPGPFPSTPPGTDGFVYASTVWDPDGAGPAPTHLVVGGSFSSISGIQANNIAAWNGATWAPLGGGLFGVVSGLTVYNGELVACGAMAGIVARWHLGGWVPFGVPLGGSGTQRVRAMAIYNGQLVVGGEFTSIAGVAANSIARWNGTTWQPLGAGVRGTSFPRVECLAVYNGELIAGGEFTVAGGLLAANIARWNGAAWASLGIGLVQSSGGSPACNALTVYNGDLIAGGLFENALPGPAVGSPAYKIARWNGSEWQSLAGGVLGSLPGTNGAEVRALAVHNGWLVVGGRFFAPNVTSTQSIARWSDTPPSWSWLGTGMNNSPWSPPSVDTLAVHNGDLVAGGYFETAGGVTVNHLARWNSSISWHAFQSPWFVYSFAQLGSRMIAGGYFAQSTGSTTPGAYHVVAWDGATLAPLGAGLNHAALALKSFTHPGPLGDRELVCAGSFIMAGGQPANRIARWVENPLIAFPPPAWEPMGSGFNNTVYALERFNESTFAAGDFTASGATTVNRIARWNGAAWETLGAGLNNSVHALRSGAVTFNSIELLVGGSFTTAGGAGANRIARWVVTPLMPGSGSWSPMGPGFTGTVRAIERHNNATYAAGDFTASGTTTLNRIARWTGSAWVDVGGGFNGPVTALKSAGGFLYAAGAFTTAGGGPATRVARWDGTSWSEVRGGADSSIDALGVFQNEVHAGGAFSEVSNGVGSPVSSPGWARYTPDGHPWVARQPAPEQAACGGDAYFTAASAPGYGALQCQWRKDGVALANGPTGTGSSISGATSVVTAGSPIHFHVYDASSADEGAYDCQISTACGAATTSSAPLTVTGCCYADCNADSQLTVADFGCFQTKFVAQDPYADCNEDSQFTVADFGCFQTKFVAGCP